MFIVILMFILVVVGVSWFFVSRDRGAKEPAGALWAAFGFGFLALIISAILEAILLPGLSPGSGVKPTIWMMLGVGLIEESAKFLPLAAFIYHKRYFNEHTDGVLYFAICGLAFGMVENILYTTTYGASAGVLRIALVPFFHAAGAGIVGFYLARAKLRHNSWGAALVALLAMSTIHGIYDFGLNSQVPVLMLVSLMITLSLNIELFLFYKRATAMDRALGLSANGTNKFCRSCGTINTDRTLYCQSCGLPA